MPRGCLFAFMRSETAFRMLRSTSMGTKLQDHHPGFMYDLPVPYPDRRFREEIRRARDRRLRQTSPFIDARGRGSSPR